MQTGPCACPSHTAWLPCSSGSAHAVWCKIFSALLQGEARTSFLLSWTSSGESRRGTPSPRCLWTSYIRRQPFRIGLLQRYSLLLSVRLLLSRSQALLWKTDLSLGSEFGLLNLSPKTTEINSVLKSISTDFHGLEIRFHCLFSPGSQQFLTASLWLFFLPLWEKKMHLTCWDVNYWAPSVETTALLLAPFHRQGSCIWNDTFKLQRSREQKPSFIL